MMFTYDVLCSKTLFANRTANFFRSDAGLRAALQILKANVLQYLENYTEFKVSFETFNSVTVLLLVKVVIRFPNANNRVVVKHLTFHESKK